MKTTTFLRFATGIIIFTAYISTTFANPNLPQSFEGYLQYDDCLSENSTDPTQPALLQTGCPIGYNFILRDLAEIQKISLEQTSLTEKDFCPENECELMLMLGDTPDYNDQENNALQLLLSEKQNTKVTLTLNDISIGNYSSARFILNQIESPAQIAETGSILPVFLAIIIIGLIVFAWKMKTLRSLK